MPTSNYQSCFTWQTVQQPQAFLLPPGLPDQSQDLKLLFLNIGGPKANQGGCPLPSLSGGQTQSTFTLSWTTFNSQPVANIAIPKASAYAAAVADRTKLAADFAVFRQQVDLLEAQNNGCLQPGQGRVLVDRVVRALPMTLAEAGTYYFNLTPTRRSVDLAPGMRLRLIAGAYQYGGNAGFSEQTAALNGFTAAGESFITLSSLPTGGLAFGGWLGAILPGLSSPVQPGTCGVEVLGPLDLQSLGARRCWRLIYPAVFNGVGFTTGDPKLSDSVALLGAASLQDLETATAAYVNQGCCAAISGATLQPICAYFAGRTIAIPEIQVTVNGSWAWVPVGTTLRQLAESYCQPALAQYPGPSNSGVFGVQLSRWGQNAFPVTPSALPSIYYQLTAATITPGAGNVQVAVGTDALSAWDITLAVGDRVTLWQ